MTTRRYGDPRYYVKDAHGSVLSDGFGTLEEAKEHAAKLAQRFGPQVVVKEVAICYPPPSPTLATGYRYLNHAMDCPLALDASLRCTCGAGAVRWEMLEEGRPLQDILYGEGAP